MSHSTPTCERLTAQQLFLSTAKYAKGGERQRIEPDPQGLGIQGGGAVGVQFSAVAAAALPRPPPRTRQGLSVPFWLEPFSKLHFTVARDREVDPLHVEDLGLGKDSD